MSRWKPRAKRTHAPTAARSSDALTQLQEAAEALKDECAYWLALYAQNHPDPPGLVLMLLPEGHATQPLQREAVLDMARALGLDDSLAALGPLAPILVLGEGRAVLMGSAVGANLSPSKINAPGGAS